MITSDALIKSISHVARLRPEILINSGYCNRLPDSHPIDISFVSVTITVIIACTIHPSSIDTVTYS